MDLPRRISTLRARRLYFLPGYPVLLAGVFKVFGTYSQTAAIAAIVLNAVFAALTCWALFHLGKLAFDARTGLVAAGLWAIYPPSVWYTLTTIWDTCLFTMALVLSTVLIYRFSVRATSFSALGVGAACGLTTLINPAGLPFFVLALIWAWRRNPGDVPLKSRYLAIAILAGVCVVLPWLVRNGIVFGHPVLRSGFAMEMDLGNAREWRHELPSYNDREFKRYVALGEFPYIETCKDDVTHFIASHPGKFAANILRRAVSFWANVFKEGSELGGGACWRYDCVQ